MSSIYAMQRANGDWFALKERGNLRVPVFPSNREAMQARSFNVEMLVFKPVLLDDRALKDLEPIGGERPAYFWLVEKASTSMKRGIALSHLELAALSREPDRISPRED
jgi:hypothetical protein